MHTLRRLHTLLLSAALAAATGMSGTAGAAALPQSPLFLGAEVPPLAMITMARNHKLYFEAYNDASDVNGDGKLDTTYKPQEIDYYGYFDSTRCYTYDSGAKVFKVSAMVDDASAKTCANGSDWSGDFLNYLTTTRMDALRKTLYGGKRVVDTTSRTVLERAYVPQDAHSWGKAYEGISEDGYDIRDYSPLGLPDSGKRNLFASTNPAPAKSVDDSNPPEPLLRYIENNSHEIWNWVSKERPVAGKKLVNPGENISGSLTDRRVRVEVCTVPLDEDGDGVAAEYESFCKQYTDSSGNATWKPTGLLHQFGEDGSMNFGLMTGSYEKNYSGGVLRRTISSFADEINPDTGQFDGSVDGIVDTIDKLRTVRFNTSGNRYQYECGFAFEQQREEGKCQSWGNPIAEMMYESLRYFGGKNAPTAAFNPGSGSTGESTLGLPSPGWDDPFGGNTPECSQAFQLVLSDTNPTFDDDQLPGSPFGSFSGDSDFNGNTLDVSTEGQAIWNQEVTEGAISSPVFVGTEEGSATGAGAPTAKDVSTFGNLRGLSPEEPTKRGSYNAGSVAYFGKKNDLNSTTGEQRVDTFSVALSSPLPRIQVPVGSGANESIVTLVPFSKSVGSTRGDNRNIDSTEGEFQATNAIVDFYVQDLENLEPGSSGLAKATFRINFEDSEMGTDFDQDAIVLYTVEELADGTLDVTLESETAAGDVNQHIGYVIQGTTQDGIYLEVRDEDTGAGQDDDYYLDTPDGQVPPSQTWNDGAALPLTHARNFTPGTAAAGTFPHDPLWYAAKYGGFIDANDNQKPDVATEWDEDGDGTPDNYFFVSNVGELGSQLESAFNEVLARVGSASAVSINSTRLDSGSVAYQATFNSQTWEGDLKALNFNDDGTLDNSAPKWSARKKLPDASARTIWTQYNGNDIEFDWTALPSPTAKATAAALGLDEDRIDWIRGDRSNEKPSGSLRERRDDHLLGDIVDSAPEFVGDANLRYAGLQTGNGGAGYASYLENVKATGASGRDAMVYVGANDGMLHAFDAETGIEKYAYVPEALLPKLSDLTSPSYGHKYYVNGSLHAGDAFVDPAGGTPSWHNLLLGAFAHGARGIFALDITDPGSFGGSTALWEVTPDDFSGNAKNDLGYVLGEPQIALTENDEWVAIFGNGYNSASGASTLYMVDLADGSLVKAIRASDSGGGLGTPFLLDKDGNRKIDAVYAGDLAGNLWKFDLETEEVATEGAGGNKVPLFQAVGPDGAPQPITTRPVVGVTEQGQTGFNVYIGTGQYDFVGDSNVGADPQIQSIYGLHDEDDGSPIAADSSPTDGVRYDNLVEQTIESQFTATFNGEELGLRTLSSNDTDYTGKAGWRLDLKVPGQGAEGERVIARPILRFDRLIVSTFIPNDSPCEFGGESWLLEFDATNGASFSDPIYDLNQDGSIDQDDLPKDDSDNPILPSGMRTAATTNPPAIISDSQNGDGGGGGDGTGGGGEPCLEQKVFSTLEGDQEVVGETCNALGLGRQSWRQLR